MCAGDKISEGFDELPNGAVPVKAIKTKMSKIAQYYRLKQKHGLMSVRSGSDGKPESGYTPDWLAVTTAYTKQFFQFTVELTKKFQKSTSSYLPGSSKLKMLLTPTILLLIAWLVARNQDTSAPLQDNKIWKVLYILSFATHFGAQMWMTFVSGIVLYFSLPRHVFGQVQEVIFPFYFLFNSITSLLMVVSFINTHHSISYQSETLRQVVALTLCLCVEMWIRLYVAKDIVLLKQRKTKIEAEAGTGMEIGHQVLGELANCPHYMGILKKFRRLHSYTSIATIVTVLCSLYHLNYVIDKLCL